MRSIRRMLLLLLLGALSGLMLLVAAFSYRAGLQEANEMFDARLVQSARVLLSLVDQPLGDLASRPGEPIVIEGWHGDAQGVGDALAFKDGHAYETKLAFQVVDAGGHLLLRSDIAPQSAMAPLVAGFADVDRVDGRWRVFSLRSPTGLWFQSGERHDIRGEIAEEIATATLLPFLLALPLMAVLIWLSVRWATRSLVRVSEEIGARDPRRLEPLAPTSFPLEVQGIVAALNALLGRLDAALQRERRFIADAAHELRTPIAALKVHAGNLRHAVDARERDDSQAALDIGIDRLARLVAQLLSLGRSEQVLEAALGGRLSLDALVRNEIDDAMPMIDARGMRFEHELAALDVVGEEAALQTLVRNLIDNALRYTPPGGRMRVTLTADGSGVLRVEDSGPGIAPEARERVFERFHRELGTSVPGSGLGLSIVREVALRHGASVRLDTSPGLGGLRVEVAFAQSASRN